MPLYYRDVSHASVEVDLIVVTNTSSKSLQNMNNNFFSTDSRVAGGGVGGVGLHKTVGDQTPR